MGNKGAFIRFEAPDMKPNIVTFSAVVSVVYLLHIIVLVKLESWNWFTFYSKTLLIFWYCYFTASPGCEANGICKQFSQDVQLTSKKLLLLECYAKDSRPEVFQKRNDISFFSLSSAVFHVVPEKGAHDN